MQAVILAGGKGTRLKPLTVNFPKPLVPLGDLPILEIVIRQLARSGFEEIILSTGHLAELIQAYCGDGSRWGIRIRYFRETTPLNTAGALGLIPDLAPHFLAMNGDILTTLDYRDFFTKHTSNEAFATVATRQREATIDFGVVHSDESGILQRWEEKPSYKFDVSMGIYMLNRDCISLIRPGEPLGMPDLLLRIRESKGPVRCHRTECDWLDIGRIEDYEKAQEDFAVKRKIFLGD